MKTRRYTGFAMSDSQVSWFWRLWADACKEQGWDTLSSAEKNVKRMEVLAGIFGRSISLKAVDSRDGFDRVKRRLEELAGKVHNQPEDEGKRGRVLYRVGELLTEFQEVYGIEAEASFASLLKARFKVVHSLNSIQDLSTEELVHLSMTLEQRIKSKMTPPKD